MDQVRGTGADIILGNTYHLMLRPGAERVARLGGLHEMTGWAYPILTDSGGFQVMSLAALRKLTEYGVTFQSHIDGSKHQLTPERSVEIQVLLDSNIIMQLDECIRLPASREETQRAMELSLRWAERSRDAFCSLVQPGEGRALFGIVQGARSPTCASAAPRLWLPSTCRAMPWAGWPWASRRQTCSARSRRPSLSAGGEAALPHGCRYAG